MKYTIISIITVWLLFLVGCEPEPFSNPSNEIPSGVSFIVGNNNSLGVGNDGCITINGKDSCLVELNDGNDIVELETVYTIGDKYFYGGITTYIKTHPLAEGKAQCRLYNTKYGFDTTICIVVSNGTNPGGEDPSGYIISPNNTQFSISEGTIEITVTGPKPMGTKNLNTFVLFDYGGNVIYDNTTGVYIRKQSLQLSHVGTAGYKFYNEEWDTTIRIEVLPQYSTYSEPDLDFDDTRDSIILKIGTPDSENESENTFTYLLDGPVYSYTLTIRLQNEGTLKDYDISFSDEAAKEELRKFVAERYFRCGTHNGYYIYTRGFNQTAPSPYSEDNTVLIENFIQGTVSYKNPVRSWEW